MKRLWLIQAIGNALLFWAAFAWLGLRDAKTSQLVETVIFGLLILIPWLWLQDGTLSYCADRSKGLWPTFRRSLATLALFSAVVIVFAAVFWALGKLEGPLTDAGQRTASWLTFHFRKPVKPQTWIRAYLAVLWGVRWIVLPVLMLPLASGVAHAGVRGFRIGARRVFWLQYLIALLIGFWVPTLLTHWVPGLTGTVPQILSFALRFGVAYVLIISSWLALAFFSAQRGRAGAQS
jgi:hypothetical protein